MNLRDQYVALGRKIGLRGLIALVRTHQLDQPELQDLHWFAEGICDAAATCVVIGDDDAVSTFKTKIADCDVEIRYNPTDDKLRISIWVEALPVFRWRYPGSDMCEL